MNLKKELIREFKKRGSFIPKMRYWKKSPYMKNGYKPEYVEQEVRIYLPDSTRGYCITEEEFNNIDIRNEYVESILYKIDYMRRM